MYNSKLEDTKNNITVVNAIFSSIQENCGVKAGATSNIIEPFIPLESFIFYENVEVERLEVSFRGNFMFPPIIGKLLLCGKKSLAG